MAMAEEGNKAAVEVVRTWRTALLTLRDESTSAVNLSGEAVLSLLNHHLLLNPDHNNNNNNNNPIKNYKILSRDLPSHELCSDLVFLFRLSATSSSTTRDDADVAPAFSQIFQFIYDVNSRVSLHISSSYWVQLLFSFERMLKFLIRSCTKRNSSVDVVVRAVNQSLEVIRSIAGAHQRNGSLLETTELLKFLLSLAEACSQDELLYSFSSSGYNKYAAAAEFGKNMPRHKNSLWEIRCTVFTMIGEVFSRAGSSVSVDIWKTTIGVLKKDMDVLASSSVLVQDSVVARFYSALFNCLHLVLADPKGPLTNHVAGFIAALRKFFSYGISDRSPLLDPSANYEKRSYSAGPSQNVAEGSPKKSECGRYRPPHLRQQDRQQQKRTEETFPSGSDLKVEPTTVINGASSYNSTSSDSDCSDSDATTSNTHCCRARVAAIVCIQDLCRVDPKLFTAQWTMLLPTSDVLQPRKYEATLMTCLLFDPYFKARVASASTLLSMLDGPATVFLQVAEYKDSVKRGSFTSLSSSLGQILMQLHTGILFLIQHETRGGLLPSVFKILMLVISSTPYSRMPGDLLPTVISSLQAKIKEGFPQRSDQSSLLAIVINSLTSAISSSPSSPKVREMFEQELSRGNFEAQGEFGVLSSIFQYSESVNNPTLSLEALQALRAVSHHYPDIIGLCWTHISSILHGILKINSSSSFSWKRNTGSVGEKVVTAAVKVLDECLRAISGFKGTEDVFDDKTFDTPFTSDCTRTKKVSSAPSHRSESREVRRSESESCILATKQWSEALEKHLPLVLSHTSSMSRILVNIPFSLHLLQSSLNVDKVSAMIHSLKNVAQLENVRTASVTCFAGLTSSVFSSLTNEEQFVVLSSTINVALHDEVPSVRSAACRAIGVITCFPLISQSAEMLGKFTHAVVFNTRDSLVLVRIAASWALANICDSLRHFSNAASSERCTIDENKSSRLIAVPLESALRMTKDNDKIKANAVRALGNLSRFVDFTGQFGVYSNKAEDSCWLGKMVQSFISCVATGNVKVQWNVCHALSNLFMNETLVLKDMNWASSVFSILLVLLRDSPNYKIRIQAAAALAVPATIVDYGESFSDVIKGVEHTVENLSSEQILPSSFKYRIALEKQLTSTMLHVLGLAACADNQRVKDFIVKKACFLEEWLKVLVSSVGKTNNTQVVEEAEFDSAEYQKRHIITTTITSLIQVFKTRNLFATAEKFEKLMMNSVE